MLNLKNKENELLKKIFLYPIVLSVFSILITGIFIFFIIINYEKKDTIKDIDYILNEKKQYIKEKVLDISNSIDLNLKQATLKAKKRIFNKVNNVYYQLLSLDALAFKNKKEIAIKYLNLLNNYLKNYVFAYDAKTGIVYVHKIKKFIGKNTKNIMTKSGESVFERNEYALKNNGGFYETYFYKPNDLKKKYLKIDYIKYVPKYDLIIGSGIYVANIKKEIENNVLARVNKKRFGNGNYFFIIKRNGVLLVNPTFKDKVGKNILNLKDKTGKYFIKEIIQKALNNKNGAFVTYYWINPATNKEEKKISFVVYNKSLDAIIGSGLYYKKDLEKLVNKEKKSLKKQFEFVNISIFVILTIMILITVIVSYYFSNRFKSVFNEYNKQTKALLKKVTFEATHDPLTKIPNRKYFNSKLKKEFYRAKRYKFPLSIAMIDIDYFKKINDNYGHDAGDVVLKKLATFCNKNIRETDFFARWGGEEFMFIFPHTNLENALKICQKIKNELQNNQRIQHPIKFTISCGVTELREDDTIDTFLKRVDDALYMAKENGRDRIEVI